MKFKKVLSVPAAASVVSVLTGVLCRGVGVLTLPLFTRLMTPEALGKYTLYFSWYGILYAVCVLPMTASPLLRGLIRFSDCKDRFLSGAVGAILPGCCLSFLVLLTFGRSLGPLIGLSPLLLCLLPLQVFAELCIAIYTAAERYAYHGRQAAICSLGTAVGAPLLAFVLLTLFPRFSDARILGAAAASVIFGGYAFFRLLCRERRLYFAEGNRFLFGSGLRHLPHGIGVSISGEAGRICVGRLLGEELLAPYAVAHSLGFGAAVVTNGIYHVFIPWFARKLSAHRPRQVRSLLSLLMPLIVLLSGGLSLLTPELFSLLAPPSYQGAAAIVPLLGAGVLPMFLYSVLAAAQMAAAREKRAGLCSLLAAAGSLGACVLLTARFGLPGAAMASTFSYLLLALLHGASLHKSGLLSFINVKQALLFIGLSLLLSFAIPFLYPYFWMRILLLIFLALMGCSLLFFGRGMLLEKENA